MNQYTFELTAQHRPEVLERILRVIRLRGFTVTNMEMALVDTQVRLKITVKSDRTFEWHLFPHCTESTFMPNSPKEWQNIYPQEYM